VSKHLNVHLLRHAQASAGAEDYDELSALGYQQADKVGAYLVRHNVRFGAVYLGALKRHAQTLAAIRSNYESSSLPLPIPCVLPELNEYDFRSVLRAYRDQFPDDHDVSAGRWLVVLKSALLAWARDQIQADDLESWAAFQIRVSNAAKRIASECRHERADNGQSSEVLVVTSGGVISLIAQRALGFEDESVGSLNMALKNTALNEFRVTQNGWQLQSFNALPHLSAPDELALHTRV
jgi:broad specificity phosphatase PhoE